MALFKKGQSGNPGGKRQEKEFLQGLMLEMKDAPDLRGLRRIARKLLDMAVDGDINAIKEVANRIDGKPAETIDMNLRDDRPIDEFSDSELTDILRSGSRVIEAQASPKEPDQVH